MMPAEEQPAVIAVVAALGNPPPAADDLANHEHGTVVRGQDNALLVSGPFDPSGTGRLRLRAVYPTENLRLVTTPLAIVAEVPGPEFFPLGDPAAFAAFGRLVGSQVPRVALLDLLVTNQGPAPLTVLVRTGEELAVLLTPGDLASIGPCEPPAVTIVPAGWHAKFASYSEVVPEDAPRYLVVDDWTCDFTVGADLRWTCHGRPGRFQIGRYRPPDLTLT